MVNKHRQTIKPSTSGYNDKAQHHQVDFSIDTPIGLNHNNMLSTHADLRLDHRPKATG
jgi:hypothetical protein